MLHYYVRSYIDIEEDYVRQPLEPWGYANYLGERDHPIWEPRKITIPTAGAAAPCLVIISDPEKVNPIAVE